MKKKSLFILFMLAMCLALLPTAAFADETCPHETCDEDGICTATGCGYQFPVETNLDAYPWLKSIDDVPFDEGVMYVLLYGDTGSGNTISPKGYAWDEELAINLQGHTLKSNISTTTASNSPTAINIDSQENGQTCAGTLDGSITVGLRNTGLYIFDGVTVTGKITINGAEGWDRSAHLNEGVTVEGGIETTVPGMTLKDCLYSDTAFAKKDADGNYTVLVDSDVTEITEAVKVIEHKTHSFTADSLYTECACGFECSHMDTSGNYTADETGKCTATGCGYQFHMKVEYQDNGAAVVKWSHCAADADTLLSVVNKNVASLTLVDDTVDWGGLDLYYDDQQYTLDLAGHTLTLINNAKINITTATLIITSSVDGGTIVGKMSKGYGDGTLTLGAGVIVDGSIDTSESGTSVSSLLAANTAFAKKDADGNYTVLVNASDVTEITEAVKVIEHKTHSFNSTTGKCGCGARCPHETFGTDGKCTACSAPAVVKVVIGETTTYFISLGGSNSFNNQIVGQTATVTLLADCDESMQLSNSTVSIDLNGKTLKEINMSAGSKLTVSDSSTTGSGKIQALYTVDCTATLKGGSFGYLDKLEKVSLPTGYALELLQDGSSSKLARNAFIGARSGVKVVPCTGHTMLSDNKCIYCDSTYVASVAPCYEDGDASAAESNYCTIGEALAALDEINGGCAYLKLLADCTLPADTELNIKNLTRLTLDLNGKKLTGDLKVSGHYVHITGGTLKGDVTVPGGILGLDNGTIDGDVLMSANGIVRVAVSLNGTDSTGEITGTVTVKDGQQTLMTVHGTGKVNAVKLEAGELAVSSGTITTLNYAGGAVNAMGGSFGTITVTAAGKKVDDLLFDGYGFKDANGNWYDGSNATTASNVSVKELPIKSLSLTASSTTVAYNTLVTLTATVTQNGNDPIVYTWQEKTDETWTTLANSTTTYQVHPTVGTHTYRCKAAADGYTAISNELTVTVTKGTVQTNGPEANTGLIYNAQERELVIKPATLSKGTTVQYRLSQSDSWSNTIPKAKNADTYTVYWRVLGGDNYNDLTATTPVTVTIEPNKIDNGMQTAIVNFSVPSLTYNGQPQTPSPVLKLQSKGDGGTAVVEYETLVKDTDYTVSVEPQTNVGDNYQVTITGKGNYTGTVNTSWSIDKASQTITTPTGKTTVKGLSNVDVSAWASAAGVTGGSDAGELTYTLDGTTPDGVTLTDNKLTVPDSVTVGAEIYIQVTAAATDNYNETSSHFTVTVADRADAGVTIASAPTSKTYGDSFTLTASVGTGVTGGTWSWTTSDSSILAITGGADSATVTVAAKKADTTGATVTATYTSDTHYGTATTAAIPVAKKALTITGVSAVDRVYTQSLTMVTLTGGTLQGVVAGDDVGFRADGEVSDANAGENKSVTAYLYLTGTAANNYTLTQPTGITVTIRKIDPSYTVPTGLTATYGQTLADVSLGTDTRWSWMDSTQSVGDASETAKTFQAKLTPGDTTNYNILSNIGVLVTVNKADPAAPSSLMGLKGNALSTVTLPTGWSWDDATTVMDETKEYPASYAGSANYNAKSSVGVTVTVSDKQPQALTVTMNGWTYGTAASEPQYTMPEDAAKLTTRYKVKNAADSTYTADVPTGAGDYTVHVSYETTAEIWSGSADFTIAKATPAGAPKYTAITASGKTLADAALAVNDSWPAGAVKWVDAEGNDLTDTTEVTANTAYKWIFTPTDTANYNAITGSITLWVRSSGGGGGSSASTTITVPVTSESGSVNVKAEVSKGNATVDVSDKQIEEVAADGAGSVTLDVSGLKNVDSATVPSHVVEKTNKAEDTGLTVALPNGSVTLDETALESVTENANGKDVTVSVVSVPTTKLPTAVKEIIGMEPTVVAVVDVNVTVGSKKQSDFSGGKLTISIPYTPKKGEDTSKLTVWFIRDDGTIENKGGRYDAGKKCFIFETTHLSRYLLVRVDEQFSDVPAGAYYAAAVNWAVAQNITNGIGDGKFGPDLGCTRGQIVTFLYRCAIAQGVDVNAGEDTNILSYADALEVPEYAAPAFQWACGAGIIQGYDGKLLPNDDCTRAQIVTMLFRYAAASGMDAVTMQELVSGFGDADSVPGYALPAFNWALAQGIVQGADGKLLPNDTCTRGQIVTMLYRLLGK